MEELRYKRCGEYILTLKVVSDDHNESRKVDDELRACYRCSRVMVIDILNFNKQHSNITFVKCDFDPKIRFRIGKETFSKYIPDEYFSGIEYFKTFEGALFRSTIPPRNYSIEDYTGMWYTYYTDGAMKTKGMYNKGLPIGIHYTLNEYSRDIIEVEEFSENGILRKKGNMNNGKK